jgi:hypothetical protein
LKLATTTIKVLHNIKTSSNEKVKKKVYIGLKTGFDGEEFYFQRTIITVQVFRQQKTDKNTHRVEFV